MENKNLLNIRQKLFNNKSVQKSQHLFLSKTFYLTRMNHIKKQKCGRNYHFRIRLHLALRILQDNLKRITRFTNVDITKAQKSHILHSFATELLGTIQGTSKDSKSKRPNQVTRSNMSSVMFCDVHTINTTEIQ